MQFVKHYRRTVHRATGESATFEHEFTEQQASTIGSTLSKEAV